METCVLIPQEFSLVLSPTLERRSSRIYEIGVRVWTNVRIPQGTRIHAFQGTIRFDKLEVYSYLDDTDIRHRFGCYDEITEIDRRRVRHCNWVRFLRATPTYTPDVNLLATKIKGEPIFEVMKAIPANTELVAYFVPERQEEYFLPAVHYLRNSLYRRTMDTILEESPLDLSMSLLSRVSITGSGSSDADERKSVSSDTTCSSSSGELDSPPGPLALTLSLARNTNSLIGATRVNVPHLVPKKPRERTLLPCEVCGKAFDRPSLLKRHMRTHTGEKPHVCEVCGKGFSTSSSLNTHRRIHSGEKPHQCQVCGKRFTASSNLYYHRMTHIKEKPHKCQLCSKSFPTPGDLKSHMYVHNGSWPFKCHICNRGFSKHTNLKNHLFLHTGDKPHACELCHKRFALACNLRAHMKTHEGDPQEECLRCSKVFLSSQHQLLHGYCTSCYQASQGLPLLSKDSAGKIAGSPGGNGAWDRGSSDDNSSDKSVKHDEEEEEEELEENISENEEIDAGEESA